MKALVTGAAGFIGSHLADALLDRGDDVVAVDCFTPYYDVGVKVANVAACRAHPSCSFIQADLRTASLGHLLEGVDVVFHQAAQPGVRASWDHRFGEYATHNVLATQRLLEAARQVGIRRFIHASSSSIYGNALAPTPEDAVPAPFSPYGVTKLAAEHLCRAYGQNFRFPAISLRYFTVFGPRQRPDMSIYRLIEAALSDQLFHLHGDGSQVRNFTFVSDVVAANLAAAAATYEPGIACNIAGSNAIMLRDLIALVEHLVGEPIRVAALPAMPGDVRQTDGAIALARHVLSWSPTVSLRDGIDAQIAWHRTRKVEGGR